jgi:hypothetical protein
MLGLLDTLGHWVTLGLAFINLNLIKQLNLVYIDNRFRKDLPAIAGCGTTSGHVAIGFCQSK